MNDLLHQLHHRYCEELNQSWLEAIQLYKKDESNMEVFLDLGNRLKEAAGEGYRFELSYASVNMIEQRVVGTTLFPLLEQDPDWEMHNRIKKLIHFHEEKGWTSLLPHYKLIKARLIEKIFDRCSVQVVCEHGPFYAGPTADLIKVHGSTGNLTNDLVLVSLLYGHHMLQKTP
jgi:hypothetical protein